MTSLNMDLMTSSFFLSHYFFLENYIQRLRHIKMYIIIEPRQSLNCCGRLFRAIIRLPQAEMPFKSDEKSGNVGQERYFRILSFDGKMVKIFIKKGYFCI